MCDVEEEDEEEEEDAEGAMVEPELELGCFGVPAAETIGVERVACATMGEEERGGVPAGEAE